MVSAKKFNFKRILIIIVTVIFAFSAISLVATKFIYDSIFARYDDPIDTPPVLRSMVSGRSVHKYDSGDNQLTGYYYPKENGLGLVVLVPGFNAGADDFLWQIQSFLDLGWAVFTFDTTGCGNSEGKNQVGFSQPVLDLEFTLKYIANNQQFGYNDLVLVGHSQGGYAVCCALAGNYPVSAVVCISGVNSAMEGIMQMSSDAIGKVAYGNYGFLWLYQAMLFGTDVVDREACEAISQSQVPVFIIHGEQDSQIPMDETSVISHKDHISGAKVEYLLCPGGHTDLLYDEDGTANDELMDAIHSFLLRSLSSGEPNPDRF